MGHLFGFSGTALINGAVAAGAERREAAEIESYLTENSAALDIDGDGKALPLTDGLLIIRYLFGFSGDALVQGAIAVKRKRLHRFRCSNIGYTNFTILFHHIPCH